jgi:hypothetical protein
MFLIIVGNIVLVTLITAAVVALMARGILLDHRHHSAASARISAFPTMETDAGSDQVQRAA